MAFLRWARTSSEAARGSLNAGFKSLVPTNTWRAHADTWTRVDMHKKQGHCLSNLVSHKAGFDLHNRLLGEYDRCHWLSDQRRVLLEKKAPYLFQKYGFARIAAPPHLQRQVGLKIYRGSSGTIIDPYHKRAHSPFLERWFTRKGWKETKEIFIRELRSAYTLAKLRQKRGTTRKLFYSDVEKLYVEINKAIAEGNRNALKELVTENMLSILKNEIKKREGVWDRVEWRLGDHIKVSTLQARLGAADPKDLDKAFVQITVMIKSTQYFGAFDPEGKLVAGEPSKQISVEDIWVLETFLGSSDKKFRLCGRITL